jgi:uncharacterized protein (DUF58 family)
VIASAHSKLPVYAAAATLSIAIGLLLSRPELVLLGLPFALVIGVDLTGRRPRAVRARLLPLPESAVEGDELEVMLELESEERCRVEVLLVTPGELELVEGQNPGAVTLEANVPLRVACRFGCAHWGVVEIGPAALRTRTPFGLLLHEQALPVRHLLRVFPAEPTLHELIRPSETQLFVGNQRSRDRGDGIEFADVRDYRPGDRPRSINWRATARRGTLQTNDRQLERSADVTILLDSFGNGPREGGTTFDDAVRAASALVRHALSQRDRVGLINLGGRVEWIDLRTGKRQLHKIIGMLLEAEVAKRTSGKRVAAAASYHFPCAPDSGVNTITNARHVLSPRALVIALTPLLDERSIEVLLGLSSRGYELIIVEVVADASLHANASADDELASRLWQVMRNGLRAHFLRQGVPIVHWEGAEELEAALGEVRAFRHNARRIRISI